MGGFTAYAWIDNALLDGMDYFAGVFFYFFAIAKNLVVLVAYLGIGINAIKLWFGATAVRKVAVSSLFNFMLYLAAIGCYNIVVGSIAKTATRWGSEAGGGKRVVESNLVSLMKQAENDLRVANAIAEMSPESAAAYVEQQRKLTVSQRGLGTGRTKKKDNTLTEGITNSEGPGEYLNKVNLYRSTEKNIAAAQSNIMALREVLSPVKVRDKNGNLVNTYFLNVTIKDRKGGGTNFISPASFLKVSVLLAKLLWQREINYLTIKIEQEKEKLAWWQFMDKAFVSWDALTWSDIGNVLLTMICCLAVICAAVFILVQYCKCIFEYAIVTSICVVFIPFLIADITRGLATKVLPIFWGFAIKLLILTVCMWFSLYQYIYLAASQMGEDSSLDLGVFAYILFTIVLSFIVTQNAPKIAMSILTGQPQLSMGEFLQAAGTVAAAPAIAGAGMTKVAKIAKGAGRAAGAGLNALATTGGIARESHAAAKAAGGGIAQAGGDKKAQVLGEAAAVASALGGHVKNAGKNLLHNLSHSSATKNGTAQGGSKGSSFVNRFSAKDGSVLDKTRVPEANHSSFANAKNFDENGNVTTSQTYSEYLGSMSKQGSDRGSGIAKKWKNKHSVQNQNEENSNG